MRGLHALVMARQVLYLGISDTPAWVVVKANECNGPLQRPSPPAPHTDHHAKVARANGLTPFSIYQGNGTRHSETWRLQSSPCAKTKAWRYRRGRPWAEAVSRPASRERKTPRRMARARAVTSVTNTSKSPKPSRSWQERKTPRFKPSQAYPLYPSSTLVERHVADSPHFV